MSYFYLQGIAFKVLVSAYLHSWLLLLHGSNSGSHLHSPSMGDTLMHCILCLSFLQEKRPSRYLQIQNQQKWEAKALFNTWYPEPDVSKLSLGPNRLPGRPCWCQRMFATLWITGRFCLWSQCQNMSGSSLLGDWDNLVQYPAPASSPTLCFLREQCPTCLDATQTNGSLVAIRQNRYTCNNELP